MLLTPTNLRHDMLERPMVSSPTLNTTVDTTQYKYPARHWGVQFSLNIVLTTTFSTWNSKIYPGGVDYNIIIREDQLTPTNNSVNIYP